MVESDRMKFEAIMQGLAENFNATLTKNGISLRYEALKSLDINDIAKAAMSIVVSRKYTTMPTIADFMEFMGGGSVDDRAEIEAVKVWSAICEVGGYKSVAFDDAVTQAVIQHAFGGWPRLCSETMIDQQKWFIKDFVKFYSSFSRQGLRVTGVLSGRGSLTGDKTRLIGDPAKALQIAETPADNSRFQISQIPENVRELIGHTFKIEESEESEECE